MKKLINILSVILILFLMYAYYATWKMERAVNEIIEEYNNGYENISVGEFSIHYLSTDASFGRTSLEIENYTIRFDKGILRFGPLNLLKLGFAGVESFLNNSARLEAGINGLYLERDNLNFLFEKINLTTNGKIFLLITDITANKKPHHFTTVKLSALNIGISNTHNDDPSLQIKQIDATFSYNVALSVMRLDNVNIDSDLFKVDVGISLPFINTDTLAPNWKLVNIQLNGRFNQLDVPTGDSSLFKEIKVFKARSRTTISGLTHDFKPLNGSFFTSVDSMRFVPNTPLSPTFQPVVMFTGYQGTPLLIGPIQSTAVLSNQLLTVNSFVVEHPMAKLSFKGNTTLDYDDLSSSLIHNANLTISNIAPNVEFMIKNLGQFLGKPLLNKKNEVAITISGSFDNLFYSW